MWKSSKEKELSQEEAIELARKRLSRYWKGISPQFTIVKSEKGFTVIPLDPEFTKKTWLISVVDPTVFAGQSAFEFMKEWHRRYSSHQVNFLLYLLPPYYYGQTLDLVTQFFENTSYPFLIAVDIDQHVADAFGIRIPPKTILIDQGSVSFEFTGKDAFAQTERQLQKFLRIKDLGLPLFEPTLLEDQALMDLRIFEFGYTPRFGMTACFQIPGFSMGRSGYREGKFTYPKPKKMENDQLYIFGDWIQDSERIITRDTKAMIQFYSVGKCFTLVAQSLKKSFDPALIGIEVDGAPIYESISGKDTFMEDFGISSLRVKAPQVFSVLENLKDIHEITLRFPNADQFPVCLYGLRFGSPFVSD